MPVQILDDTAINVAEPARFVFVYGTLRRGELRDINLLRPAPCWIGEAIVEGTIYDLGDYPGIVLRGAEGEGASTDSDRAGRCVVFGEVYGIGPELEQMLDEIEEVWPQQTGEYVKREVAVRLLHPSAVTRLGTSASLGLSHHAPDDCATLVCLVYEIAPERTLGKPVIESSDWVSHRSRS